MHCSANCGSGEGACGNLGSVRGSSREGLSTALQFTVRTPFGHTPTELSQLAGSTEEAWEVKLCSWEFQRASRRESLLGAHLNTTFGIEQQTTEQSSTSDGSQEAWEHGWVLVLGLEVLGLLCCNQHG